MDQFIYFHSLNSYFELLNMIFIDKLLLHQNFYLLLFFKYLESHPMRWLSKRIVTEQTKLNEQQQRR
jgi:hypothetical protein